MKNKPSKLFLSYVPSPTALRTISLIHTGFYRLTAGYLGRRLDGLDILLLQTKGAKSGKTYQTPMPYFEHPKGYLLIASKAGSPSNPGWFYNLRQEPNASIQVGNEHYKVVASALAQAERQDWWEKLVDLQPRYQTYQERTEREIPLVLLERLAG